MRSKFTTNRDLPATCILTGSLHSWNLLWLVRLINCGFGYTTLNIGGDHLEYKLESCYSMDKNKFPDISLIVYWPQNNPKHWAIKPAMAPQKSIFCRNNLKQHLPLPTRFFLPNLTASQKWIPCLEKIASSLNFPRPWQPTCKLTWRHVLSSNTVENDWRWVMRICMLKSESPHL